MILVATLLAASSLGLSEPPMIGVACPRTANITTCGRIGIAVWVTHPASRCQRRSRRCKCPYARGRLGRARADLLGGVHPHQQDATRAAGAVVWHQAREVPAAAPRHRLPNAGRTRHRSRSAAAWLGLESRRPGGGARVRGRRYRSNRISGSETPSRRGSGGSCPAFSYAASWAAASSDGVHQPSGGGPSGGQCG